MCQRSYEAYTSTSRVSYKYLYGENSLRYNYKQLIFNEYGFKLLKFILNINLTINYTIFLNLLTIQTFDWYKCRLKSKKCFDVLRVLVIESRNVTMSLVDQRGRLVRHELR